MTQSMPGLNPIGGFSTPGVGNAAGRTSLNDLNNTNGNFILDTLNPPPMKTFVYAPDVEILIGHNGRTIDISKDIVRGQVERNENACSSLFLELANPADSTGQPKYNKQFSRMDRITVYLTRTKRTQVFSGFLDTVPYVQIYPGTIQLRATCTLKKLLHTWWQPATPESMQMFSQISSNLGTSGDGQTDTGLGSLLRTLLTTVAHWPDQNIHIQNFPQQFLVFLNNYFTTNNILAKDQQLGEEWTTEILGSSDHSVGPKGAVGYRASDPIGSTGTGTPFYLSQIIAACDQRGLGPVATAAANSQTVLNSGQAFEAAGSSMQNGSQLIAAGQQVTQYAQNATVQNQASDAAILAAACCNVETGGGTTVWRNLCNPAVPESLNYTPNDGPGTNQQSIGLFQQQGSAWGTVQQRMNPFSAAGMFFDALVAQTGNGWRNSDPGTVIFNVQQGGSPAAYNAQIQSATALVQAYRSAHSAASGAANDALASIPGGSALASGIGGNPITNAASAAVNTAVTAPNPGAVTSSVTGGPNPDSEGAIRCAFSIYQTPWSETVGGGVTPGVGLDCSGMVQLAFKSIGINIPRDTYHQYDALPHIPPASAQRGDILQTDGGGHTGIYLGNGTWIQTGGPEGRPGVVQAIDPASCYAAMHVCPNGGVNSSAPFVPPMLAGPGGVPGTGTAGPIGTGGSATSDEGIARNLFAYQFLPGQYASDFAVLLASQPEKAYIDAQPLIQMVQAVASAGLRNFASAGNGDFIAYYPDHFGVDGKEAVLKIEDIELTDCTITLSDDQLTTHVYVNGAITMIGQADQSLGWLVTAGVATVENAPLYHKLQAAGWGGADTDLTAKALMGRFGVRPLKQDYQMAANASLEFLIACQIFMGKWASQWETQIGITFLPELFPGMRVNLPSHNLQAYCSRVVHTFDWERGFSTQATVSAASNPNAANTIYTNVPSTTAAQPTTPVSTGTPLIGNAIETPSVPLPQIDPNAPLIGNSF